MKEKVSGDMRQISTIFGGAAYGYRTLDSLFEEVVNRFPDAVALRYEDKSYTYLQVSDAVQACIARLEELGARRGDVIGLHIPRSDRYALLTLAVMLGGFVYLPLAVELPSGRLQEIINIAAPAMIVSDQGIGSDDRKIKYIGTDRLFSERPGRKASLSGVSIQENELCYIIFTSGSEGRPKGVKITHGGFSNRLQWTRDYYELGARDVIISRTPLTFDPSIQELVLPFLTGGCLLVANSTLSVLPNHLVAAIIKYGVTMMIVVPSLLRQILQNPRFPECATLRHVVCCGEPWSADLITKFHAASKNGNIYNGYGPTETTIGTLVYRPHRGYGEPFIPIGRPIKGVHVALIDDEGKNVERGEAGELIIGGICVGAGYIANAALNETRFRSLHVNGAGWMRFYFTGDLARQLPDGEILFMGRKDNQVKVNGVRIELEEIENILKRHEAVSNAIAVKVTDEHADSLHIFFTSRENNLDTRILLRHCEKWLSKQMMPSGFTQLDELPVTQNGKVDRKSIVSMLPRAAG